MSLKKYFKSNAESALTKASKNQFNISGSDFVESYSAVKQKADFDRKIFAFVDISSSLSNYVRFGLAEYDYETGIKRIYEDYPFDGTQAEQYKFLNDSNTFDYWIWKDKYPKTTGYVTLNDGDRFHEQIEVKAGPNLDNVFDASVFQTNNLYFDSEKGTTIEFWAKPTPADGAGALFQLNDSATGRLMIAPTYTDNDIVWIVESQQALSIEAEITFTSLVDHAESWHHYAFVLTSQGAGSALTASLYVDGTFTEQKIDTDNVLTNPINTISGNLGKYDDPGSTARRYYTGSLDEFRYWKAARTETEIGLNWNTHVYGGSNLSGTTNRPLGLYLKFNEGITEVAATDSKVLDYSGRVASASILNYDSDIRSLNSAIEEYDSSYYEASDPIMYSFHPKVVDLETETRLDAIAYDNSNHHNFYSLMPEWVTTEDTGDLKYISHIIGAYFDELYAQISSFEKIKDKNYQNQDLKIFPFYDKILESQGFNIGNFLAGADLLAELDDKTTVGNLVSGSISDLKNTIYRNLYNNLLYIYKSKGTQDSVRNILHCYGVDQNLFRVRNYANFTTTTIENREEISQYKDKTIDFYGLKNFVSGTALPGDATIFNFTSSTDLNAQAYVSGGLSNAFSVECNTYFPRQPSSDSNFFFAYDTSGSIFGMHAANDLATDTTWYGADTTGLAAYAVHAGRTERDGKFVLSSTTDIFFPVETDVYDLYDGTNWNLALVVEPKQDQRNLPPGSVNREYWARLIGYQVDSGQTVNSFNISSSIPAADAATIVTENKRVYVGAERTNNTGALAYRSQARIGNCKFYADSLQAEEVFLHAKYKDSEGRLKPFQNVNRKNHNDTIFVPEYLTTIFHWDFEQVNAPNPSGLFEAKDIASASINFTNAFGDYGEAVSKTYPGFGYNFPIDIKAYENEFVSKLRVTTPDESTAANVVNAQGESTITFKPNEAPAREAMIIGKSMYENISRDILKSFAGIDNFNYLIGNPVNKYRFNYKELEGLRRLYFDSVQNTPKLEKFTEYFKWMDGIVESVIENVLPASTNLAAESTNIVESHILERSKFALKYPTLENKDPQLTGTIKDIVTAKNVQLTTTIIDDRRDQTGATMSYASSSARNPNYREAIEIGTMLPLSGNIYPVTIANTPYQTASNDPRLESGVPRNFATSTVGNYRHTYEVVQSVGQHGAINGLYLANEVIPADTTSPYVSGVIPYGLPPRNKYQTIIRSTFNAPGGPETHGGGLDTAVRELSVYNNLNYRNTIVRDALDTLYKTPSAFGGYQSGSATTASYLNIYRNGYTRPVATGTGTYSHKSIRFEGSDDVLVIAATASINRMDKFTYSAWLYVPATATLPDATHAPALSQIFYLGDQATAGLDFWAHFQNPAPSLNVSIKFGDGSGGDAWTMNTTGSDIGFTPETWHHIGLSVDTTLNRGGTLNTSNSFGQMAPTLYLNGNEIVWAEIQTPTTGTTYLQQSGLSYIGASPGGLYDFHGYMDEISLWSKALNPTELANIYNPNDAILGPSNLLNHPAAKPNSVSTTGYLIGWWRCGENLQGSGPNYTIPNEVGPFGQADMLNFDARMGVTASFPPSNSAGTLNTFTTYTQKKIFDHGFVQTAIPATDLQYAWISQSYKSADINRYQNTVNTLVPNEQITFLSSSDVGVYRVDLGSGFTYAAFGVSNRSLASWTAIDFARTNQVMYEPISASSNLLGYPLDAEFTKDSDPSLVGNYFNVELYKLFGAEIGNLFVDAGSAAALNALLLHRNGPYGWSSWKALRRHDNPVVISHREGNTISYLTSTSAPTPVVGIKNVIEPPVSTTSPVFIQLKDTSFDFKTSYENKKLGFTNEDLQVAQGSFEKGLDNVPTFLDKVMQEEDINISKITVRSNVYPQTKYQFLNNTRGRDIFDNKWWRDSRSARNQLGMTSSFGLPTEQTPAGVVGTTSRYSMDARINFTTGIGPLSASNLASGSGELQNHYTTFHNRYPSPTNAKYGPLYARRSMEFDFVSESLPQFSGNLENKVLGAYSSRTITTSSFIGGGEALWEVGAQSGKNPTYNSYAQYAEELRLQGKDYSIVPEFRMEDYIETYLSNGFDFKQQQTNFLTLTGTSNTDTVKRYSAAELSEVLGTLQADTNLGITKFGLKARAYLKLLPYEGFYPQQRTVQLAAELSSSLQNSFRIDGPNATYATALQPFIAPGILFNTIKAGVAVDSLVVKSPFVTTLNVLRVIGDEYGAESYPADLEGDRQVVQDYINREVFATGSKLVSDPLGAAGTTVLARLFSNYFFTDYQDTTGAGGKLAAAGFVAVNDFQGLDALNSAGQIDRLPFEAIVNPGPYLSDWYHSEIAPGYLNSRVQAASTPKINYTLMANNFFAETVNFFIKRGLTSFESKAKDIFTFDLGDRNGKEYTMDVVMKNADVASVTDYSLRLQNFYLDNFVTDGTTNFTDLPTTLAIPGGLPTASVECLMYDNPKAFGVQALTTLTQGTGSIIYRSWSNVTPPYYNGFARTRYTFKPTAGVSSYTMKEIMDQTELTYFRADEAPQRILEEDPNVTTLYSTAGTGLQMQMSSSMVLDAVVEEKKTNFSEAGDVLNIESFDSPRHKLVIHTKYECPVLDFSNKQVTMPFRNSGSVRGMWHQYGDIPNYSDKGVFLEVTDTPFLERANRWATGSLADALGVRKGTKAIGNLATSRDLEEALIVLPYYVDSENPQTEQRFFELHSDTVTKVLKKANRPSVDIDDDQLVRQVRLMKKYVFPPFLDFVTFPNESNVKAPLMYIFEFGRTLSQQDLADIWQGVLPDAGITTTYQESVIDLDTTYEGFDAKGPDSTDIIGQNVKTLLASGDISILDSDAKLLNDVNFTELDFFVFKVKKRAEYEYSNITTDAAGDKYTFDFSATGFASTLPFFKEFGKDRLAYSYNYPYDFCSLIELAKVDAQIEMEEDEE